MNALPKPPLSLAVCGLDWLRVLPPRAALDRALAFNFPALQLDASMPGARPRELDRSARRDLAALLRRNNVAMSGLDLFIPPRHFVDPALMERAIDAVAGACGLAADIASLASGSRVVSLVLPELGADARDRLARAADAHGVTLADHAWPFNPLPGEEALKVGIDPASVLMGGGDPELAAPSAGKRLAAVRLTDVSSAGRVEPGARGGRIDLDAFAAAVTTTGFAGFVTLDLRQTNAGEDAPGNVLDRWVGGDARA